MSCLISGNYHEFILKHAGLKAAVEALRSTVLASMCWCQLVTTGPVGHKDLRVIGPETEMKAMHKDYREKMVRNEPLVFYSRDLCLESGI